jgi:hypothetical protein
VKTGWCNSQEWIILAESSKEGYGSKRAVLPMRMINIFITCIYSIYTYIPGFVQQIMPYFMQLTLRQRLSAERLLKIGRSS